jgi:deleted-in-malignant-brain-tumors protein 1
VFRRRWLGSVVFLLLGGAVGLRLGMLGLMGLSFVMLSLVVFALGLLSLVVFALRLLSLVVFTLGLLSLVVLTLGLLSLVVLTLGLLSLVVLTLGLLSLVVFALGLLSLVVFALGLLSLVVFSLGLFAFVVFPGPDLGRIVRVPVIDRVALVLVMPSLFLMGALRACRLDTPTLGRFLLGRRAGVDPSWTVEAEVIIDGRLVDHCTVHIGIVDG